MTHIRAKLKAVIVPIILLAVPYSAFAVPFVITDADITVSSFFANTTDGRFFESGPAHTLASPAPGDAVAAFGKGNLVDGDLTGEFGSGWFAGNGGPAFGGGFAATPVIVIDLGSSSMVTSITLTNAHNGDLLHPAGSFDFLDRQSAGFRVLITDTNPAGAVSGFGQTITTGNVDGLAGIVPILTNVTLSSVIPASPPTVSPITGELFALNATGRYLVVQILDFGGTAPNGNTILGGGLTELSVDGISGVPEPGTVALLGLGLVALGWVRRRSTK